MGRRESPAWVLPLCFPEMNRSCGRSCGSCRNSTPLAIRSAQVADPVVVGGSPHGRSDGPLRSDSRCCSESTGRWTGHRTGPVRTTVELRDDPIVFLAMTRTSYRARDVSPVRTARLSVPADCQLDHLVSPTLRWLTAYDVIALPPFDCGASHCTTTTRGRGETVVTPRGAPGTVAGVAGRLGALAGPSPADVRALTTTVCSTPLRSPVIVQDRLPVVLHVLPPGDAVAVYPVTRPKTDEAADQDTRNDPSPPTTLGRPGAAGRVAPTVHDTVRRDTAPSGVVTSTTSS